MRRGGAGLERFSRGLFQTFNPPRAEQQSCAFSANARAAAAPNPDDAPVIKTHLFFNDDFMVE